MTEQTPKDILDIYRQAVAAVHGEEIASASTFTYYRGWYVVNIAHRYGDDSIGLLTPALACRRYEIERMTKMLIETAERRKA